MRWALRKGGTEAVEWLARRATRTPQGKQAQRKAERMIAQSPQGKQQVRKMIATQIGDDLLSLLLRSGLALAAVYALVLVGEYIYDQYQQGQLERELEAELTESLKLSRSQLTAYIIDAITDYIEQEQDLDRLARLLNSTVGQTVQFDQGKYVVTREDIELALTEWKASKKLCTSGKPNSAIGASALASCKSQGYRSREGGKSHKLGTKRVRVRGKKMKGKKYGGELPDWGSRD